MSSFLFVTGSDEYSTGCQLLHQLPALFCHQRLHQEVAHWSAAGMFDLLSRDVLLLSSGPARSEEERVSENNDQSDVTSNRAGGKPRAMYAAYINSGTVK